MAGNIGVLALQGAFAKHEQMLKKLGIPSLQIRYPSDLKHCSGLIIPGGESTTMTRQILEMDLLAPLKAFAEQHPLFGTCAGMILMARGGILSLLDITVERNAYGRQRDSFSVTLPLTISLSPMEAFFIRAPRILAIHSDEVHTIAHNEGEAVCIQQGRHLATSFHPELTGDTRLHEHFCQLAFNN